MYSLSIAGLVAWPLDMGLINDVATATMLLIKNALLLTEKEQA